MLVSVEGGRERWRAYWFSRGREGALEGVLVLVEGGRERWRACWFSRGRERALEGVLVQ